MRKNIKLAALLVALSLISNCATAMEDSSVESGAGDKVRLTSKQRRMRNKEKRDAGASGRVEGGAGGRRRLTGKKLREAEKLKQKYGVATLREALAVDSEIKAKVASDRQNMYSESVV